MTNLRTVLVIADDLTGAAEIGGIARRYGLVTRLSCEPLREAGGGVTVIDTDSRLLPPRDAAERVSRFVRGLTGPFDLIYKKTDSALRGSIRAELDVLAAHFNRQRVVLVPQNPSRGRTVLPDGRYHIDGVPLNDTAFANDPQHPARTANVIELLGGDPPARCIEPESSASDCRVIIGAADSANHMRKWANIVTASAGAQDILPAGGADFFTSILESRGCLVDPKASTQGAPFPPSRLFVCGSATGYSAELIRRAQREGVAIFPMLDDTAAWAGLVRTALESCGRAVMLIARPLDRAEDAPRRMEARLTEAVAAVLSSTKDLDQLLLMMEGGATAAAVCRRMGWREFDVTGELASGVVQLRANCTEAAPALVIKPGSYIWPDAVWGGRRC
jgi:uncharacterized protein YgbK (DUF1537 family)